VLLAHGFGQTRHSWGATQARLAAAGHRSLAFDMRGHGASGRNAPGRDYEAAQFVDDLGATAAALGGRPVLVGASMGGLTGLLAQAGRDLFSAMVLVDVTPRWEAAGMQRIQGFMRAHPDGFATLDDAADAIAAYQPQRAARKTPRQLEALLHPDATGRLRWHWDVRLLDGFVANSARLQAPLEAAARAVRVPTLLLSGGRSDLVSDATIAHFLDLVPQACTCGCPTPRTCSPATTTTAFADALLEFLRAQCPAQSLPPQTPAASPRADHRDTRRSPTMSSLAPFLAVLLVGLVAAYHRFSLALFAALAATALVAAHSRAQARRPPSSARCCSHWWCCPCC
jgi:pimeloyl-ACP methyl ester carboxylesterase